MSLTKIATIIGIAVPVAGLLGGAIGSVAGYVTKTNNRLLTAEHQLSEHEKADADAAEQRKYLWRAERWSEQHIDRLDAKNFPNDQPSQPNWNP